MGAFFHKIWNMICKRSLKVDIISSFTLLFLISNIVSISYFYYAEKKIELDYSKESIFHKNKVISQQFMNSLETAHDTSFILKHIVEGKLKNQSDSNTFSEFFLQILKYYSFFDAVYLGLPNGNFISAERVKPSTQLINSPNKKIPHNYKFLTQIQNREKGKGIEYWNYYDDQNRNLYKETNENLSYDARTRPWYISADQSRDFSWSSVYLFSYTNAPGITASIPVIDLASTNPDILGVIGIDITLADVSTVLSSNLISKNAQTIIFSSEGDIVATSANEMLQNEKVRNINEIKNKIVKRAFSLYKEKQQDVFNFQFDGDTYLGSIIEIKEKFDIPWYICSIVPLNDLTESTERVKRNALILSLSLLIMSFILVFILSKKISYPIVEIAKEAQRIKNFDLSSTLRIKSNVQEVKVMVESFHAMKNSLISFSKFIPKNLVLKLIKKGGEIKLGGKKKELTMFFSDIEGFTTISEGMPAEKVVGHLSEYLNELSNIIMESNGTIDKYIGDSIMAFWGAPFPDRDQVYNCCHAALLCQKRLSELNRKWELEGKPALRTRIGLHTAEVVVGYIGSEEKMNYTLVGDGANLASRLEGINKYYHTYTLVSEVVYQAVKKDFLFRPLDVVAVKGKTQGIKIYELVAQYKNDSRLLPSERQEYLCKNFEKAFDYYLKKEWDRALEILNEIYSQYPTDYLTKMYIERCETYKKSPPSAEWDGVYVFTQK